MWIVRLALRRPYTIAVMAMLILMMGILSIRAMLVDIFPNIDIPVVLVVWNYPGLSADDIEKRVVFLDEDVSGGASAYMFQKVFEEQGAYRWLDAEPRTITAKDHRTAYGSDGDYFSKPNAEEIEKVIKQVMQE